MIRVKFSFIIPVVLLALTAAARDNSEILKKFQPPQTDTYNIAQWNRVTRRANAWINTTNCGIFGNYNDAANLMLDPENWMWAPQCEFPGGSGIQNIYVGGLWIGALIDSGAYTFPRVSIGFDGWIGTHELWPGEVGGLPLQDHYIVERSCIPGAVNPLGEPVYSPEAVAPQEYLSTFCDTLTETYWVAPDPTDGPHNPLGLKVTQKIMCWDAPDYCDFIIFQYTVKNIGSRFLRNLYLGIAVDGDVGHQSETNRAPDDISGFWGDDPISPWKAAFTADNDGRPSWLGSGSDFTCPGVSGVYLLSPQDSLYQSFNWCNSSTSPDQDFGPHWIDDGAPQNWTQTYGTPTGDARKYFIMSNHEIDYDQWYVSDPPWLQAHPQVVTNPFGGSPTTHDWAIESDANVPDVANGSDTRYVMSWGPLGIFDHLDPYGNAVYRLNPGDSLKLTFAYVCGDGFHNPQNPQGDLTGLNPIDPSKYVYTDFINNLARAKALYDLGPQLIVPYAPQNYRVTAAPDSSVVMAWNAFTNMPGTLVNIFRRLEGQQYGTVPLNSQPLTGTTYTDNSALLGQLYHYKAQARLDTINSAFSSEISHRAGAPLAPTGLEKTGTGNGWIGLHWNPNVEPDLDHYTVYRRDTLATFQVVGTVPAATQMYTDNSVTNGLKYTYRVSATDNINLESFLSDSVSATAMGFTDELLVVREKIASGLWEWNDDLLNAFYQQMFTDIGENPAYMTILTTATAFPSMTQLSPYKMIWLMHDIHSTSHTPDYVNNRNAILTEYIHLGGKVIMSGRRMFSGTFRYANTWGWQYVSNGSMLGNDFKVDSIFATKYPDSHPPEFTAAIPLLSRYPALQTDTNKVNLLVPQLPDLTWLLETDAMIPDQYGEPFYAFQSTDPDNSPLQGRAVGLHYLTPYFANIILTFPLYAMQPYESVKALADSLLEDIRLGIEEPLNGKPVMPTAYALRPVYPNPFNPATMIRYDLPAAGRVSLKVYNLAGRLVATVVDGWRAAGSHEMTFDGRGLASGMYFVRMQAGKFEQTRKMVLLK